MSTAYHAKYFAHELTRQASGDDPDRLSRALFDAQVDLNPHQIDAALFALRSPVSGGAVLADEVGLGKTIEFMSMSGYCVACPWTVDSAGPWTIIGTPSNGTSSCRPPGRSSMIPGAALSKAGQTRPRGPARQHRALPAGANRSANRLMEPWPAA